MITNATGASAFARALPAIAPEAAVLPQGVTKAAAEFSKVMGGMDSAAINAMSGQGETQDLVQAIARAEIALETVVAIRDKVVEAYQEIMRMPV